MIETGIGLLANKVKLKPEEIRSHTLDLFAQRLKSLFSSEGFPYDVIEAVQSTGIDSFVDARHKVIAFAELKQQPHFEPLATTFRRVVSILNEPVQGEVQPDLLSEPPEIELYSQYLKICGPVEQFLDRKEYGSALKAISSIKDAVDRFFDKVMVMVEDKKVRENRLCLLYKVSRLFSQIADFSKIVLKKG
jgi:glycyl-tRNA synthetase beta chain